MCPKAAYMLSLFVTVIHCLLLFILLCISLTIPNMASAFNQVTPKPIVPLEFSDSNGITGCTVYIPQSKDNLASDNYFVSLCQTKPNETEKITILYPLYHLDKFNPFLNAIKQGVAQEIFNDRKFKGIGRKLLVEYQDTKYFIENKGGYENPTKIIQKKGRESKVIEVEYVNCFFIMLEKVDRHAEKYLENLANEEGRDIAKEQEEYNKQIENKLKVCKFTLVRLVILF